MERNKYFNILWSPRGLAAALAIGFFIFHFVNLASCGGFLVCGSMRDMALVFPLYLPIMFFAPHLHAFGFISLYLLSSVIYTAFVYSLVATLEKDLHYTRNRPRITLKKI